DYIVAGKRKEVQRLGDALGLLPEVLVRIEQNGLLKCCSEAPAQGWRWGAHRTRRDGWRGQHGESCQKGAPCKRHRRAQHSLIGAGFPKKAQLRMRSSGRAIAGPFGETRMQVKRGNLSSGRRSRGLCARGAGLWPA